MGSTDRICTVKRGPHATCAGTDGVGDALTADNLDAGVTGVKVIMALPIWHFGQVSSVPVHARLACRSGRALGALSIGNLKTVGIAAPVGQARRATTLARIR
jgi:hypothetical protein